MQRKVFTKALQSTNEICRKQPKNRQAWFRQGKTSRWAFKDKLV